MEISDSIRRALQTGQSDSARLAGTPGIVAFDAGRLQMPGWGLQTNANLLIWHPFCDLQWVGVPLQQVVNVSELGTCQVGDQTVRQFLITWSLLAG